MKNLLLTIVLATTVLTTFGQDSTKTKVYHNEFGIDATAFIKQFLNFNNGQYPDNYSAIYYLTYRRHFKCGNIRFAIGGDYKSTDLPTGMYGDNNTYNHTSFSGNIRLGYEFFNNLNKHWQVFYGLDFRPSMSYDKTDNQYWNNPSAGYINGMETKSQTYGFAPLLGFRFKITDRLSMSTETSFSINFEQQHSRQFFNPTSSLYPAMPDVNTKSKQMFSSFTLPLSLFVTFDI